MGKDLTGMFERAFGRSTGLPNPTPMQKTHQNSHEDTVPHSKKDMPSSGGSDSIDDLLFPEKTAARAYERKKDHIDTFLNFLKSLNEYELKWLTDLEAGNKIITVKKIKDMVEKGVNLHLERISPNNGPMTLIKREYIQDSDPEIEFCITMLGRDALRFIRTRGKDDSIIKRLLNVL